MFDESVRMRMIADVPLGAFLSGGIDSSSVVASMARQSSDPIKTFSIGFDEGSYNELAYAAAVAERYHTDHHTMTVRPDSVNLVPRLVSHFDEPFADSSAIPTFLVSQFAAQHVKVVLTGDGGDELFGGYPNFLALEGHRKFDAIPQSLRRVIAAVSEILPYSGLRQELLMDDQPVHRARTLLRVRAYAALPQPQPVEQWVDDAARRGKSPAGIRRLPAARRCRHHFSSFVFRGDGKAHWRHAGESRSDVDGEFARGTLPVAGS